MSDQKLVPTWVYDKTGGSKLIDLPEGSPPPSGWELAPPVGVALIVEEVLPVAAPPSTPVDAGMAGLEERLVAVEKQLAAMLALLEDQTKPADADEQPALLARAKELGLTPHHRTGAIKLREMIAEAEAAAKAGET